MVKIHVKYVMKLTIQKTIMCNSCCDWNHHKCQKLTKKAMEGLADMKGLPYTCLQCRPMFGVNPIVKFIRGMSETLESTGKQVQKNKTDI